VPSNNAIAARKIRVPGVNQNLVVWADFIYARCYQKAERAENRKYVSNRECVRMHPGRQRSSSGIHEPRLNRFGGLTQLELESGQMNNASQALDAVSCL
jgi:hypothetical protein